MKRMKSGFTLAEVLITLGIIGVVAAIVMPSVMTNYTYKTVGVKLAKFMSQLEGAARPFVVQNETFTSDAASATAFITESFLIRNLEELQFEDHECTPEDIRETSNVQACHGQAAGTPVDVPRDPFVIASTEVDDEMTNDRSGAIEGSDKRVVIKDGTSFIAYTIDHDYPENDEINTDQVGEAVWGVLFAPEVRGLPNAVNKTYSFVVTELGYVYPDRENDPCLSAIYDADFQTNSQTFASDVCKERNALTITTGNGGAAGGAGS